MEVKITKWGNSLGIRLNKELAEAISLKENDVVDIQVIDNKLVILPKQSLDDMLSQITDDNLHSEIDFGTAVKEIL
jgi:antitoxin MazE